VEVRNGRCVLIDSGGENDISDAASAAPIEEEFLAAIRGENSVYSTAESLAVAEILVRAREAQNAPGWAKTA
jgi:hypothetical protein